MKKSISFLSAGWDETVRIWKENTFLHWTCEHVLQHKGWIAQVIMNRAEDLIISCGDPKNITFWTKNKNKWECS
jgi:WD40 repeat protein